jgi:hypothetical protein
MKSHSLGEIQVYGVDRHDRFTLITCHVEHHSNGFEEEEEQGTVLLFDPQGSVPDFQEDTPHVH